MRVMIVAACAGVAVSGSAYAGILSGVPQSDFGGATVETFKKPYVFVSTYDFKNGLTYENLNGESDHVNYTGGYGMGNAPFISSGSDGGGDGYFGTGPTPTTFVFRFQGGTTHFGFLGAESHVNDLSFGRNGELDLEFYDLDGNSLGVLAEKTPIDIHAWSQWHGFATDDGRLIGSVLFRGVGHMVVDNASGFFVPAPGTVGVLGALALFARRRR
jgi:hypothetical protein